MGGVGTPHDVGGVRTEAVSANRGTPGPGRPAARTETTMLEVRRLSRVSAGPRRWPLSWAQLGLLAMLAVFGFYLLYPLLLIGLNSFNTARIGAPPVYSARAWAEAWATPGVFQSLWNTLNVAFWYQLISFPIGVLL